MSNYSGYISGERKNWHRYPPCTLIAVPMDQKPTIKEKIKNYFKRFKKEQKVMKFKVGDKVRIKKPGSYHNNMVAVITKDNYESITDKLGYQIRIGEETNPHGCVWFDEELELIERAAFTKSDLKDGMVVECRNGDRCLLLGKCLVDSDGVLDLNYYDEDLIYTHCYMCPEHAYDIIKVYSVQDECIGDIEDIFDYDYLKLIWERKEEKKELKYKVGDRVKMRDDLVAGRTYGGLTLLGYPMYEDVVSHHTVTISDTTTNGNYTVKEHGWIISEDMIEGLVAYKEMTVAEIEKKLGYKVKIVDGE